MVIINVFLVFNFKVNLLFNKRLTKSGLKGRFDFIKMRIVSQEGKGYTKGTYKV